MSVISDVQELYTTLHTTWSKVRIHVISHVTFFALVVWLGGMAFDNLAIPSISPRVITENAWYGLARETGLIYILLALPVIIISVYFTMFDLLGKILATIFSAIFFIPPTNVFRGVSADELQPIALSLPNDDFELEQLAAQLSSIMSTVQEKYPKEWEVYNSQIRKISGNSMQYFGDFCALLILWVVFFSMFRSHASVEASNAHFWPAGLALMALTWLASVRASRTLAALPTLQVRLVSAIMQAHPGLMPSREVGDSRRRDRYSRLEDLLKARTEREEFYKFRRPSIRRVFWPPAVPANYVYHPPVLDRKKINFYERGRQLDLHGSPNDLSFADFLSYKLFVFLERRLKRAWRTLLLLLHYAFTGIPS